MGRTIDQNTPDYSTKDTGFAFRMDRVNTTTRAKKVVWGKRAIALAKRLKEEGI